MILINLQCVIFALESAEVKNPTHCADLRQDDLQDGDHYDDISYMHNTFDDHYAEDDTFYDHDVENLIRMPIII